MAKVFARQFYKSKAWERARQAALIRDKGLCQTPGCYRPAEEVHHIVHLTPENIHDGSVALDLGNLVCLCRECHMRLHDKDRVKPKETCLTDICFDGARPAPLFRK